MGKNQDPNPFQEPQVGITLHLGGKPPDSDERRLGITFTHEDGLQDIGRAAVRNTFRAAAGREPLPPQAADERLGIKLTHEDGSFDTGTRAIRNMVRVARGSEPKVYKRTIRR